MLFRSRQLKQLTRAATVTARIANKARILSPVGGRCFSGWKPVVEQLPPDSVEDISLKPADPAPLSKDELDKLLKAKEAEIAAQQATAAAAAAAASVAEAQSAASSQRPVPTAKLLDSTQNSNRLVQTT